MKKGKKKGKSALGEALLKVATGYSVEEVTEEYAEVDGEMKLLKRKETKKDIPPDLKAVQILLAEENGGFAKMSDEELEKEKERLLGELEKTRKRSTVSGGGESETNGGEPLERVDVEEKTAEKKVAAKKSAVKKSVKKTGKKTTAKKSVAKKKGAKA